MEVDNKPKDKSRGYLHSYTKLWIYDGIKNIEIKFINLPLQIFRKYRNIKLGNCKSSVT